jgi:hypothetical protein
MFYTFTDDGPMRTETCRNFVSLIIITLKIVHCVGLIRNSFIAMKGKGKDHTRPRRPGRCVEV